MLTAEQFAKQFDVSRETLSRYQTYLKALRLWQKKINLIGSSTLDDPWLRHFADCLQLQRFFGPRDQQCFDLGSGAGFPGLVLGIDDSRSWFLVESNNKKAAFLRHVVRQTGSSNVEVKAQRCEEMKGEADIITARAFAPLTRLFELSTSIRKPSTRYLLLKGANASLEIQEASSYWCFNSETHTSVTSTDSSILVVKGVTRRGSS